MSLNYTFGTLIREIALLLTALIFAVPIFVMINVAFMPTCQQNSPPVFCFVCRPISPLKCLTSRGWTANPSSSH